MRFSSPMTTSRLRRPISASTQTTLFPSEARATPRLAVVVVFPTPPLPDVMVMTRAVMACLLPSCCYTLLGVMTSDAPLLGHDLPVAHGGDLRSRAGLAVVRGDGDVVRNPKLHGAHVERAHQRFCISVRARMDRPAQPAPYEHIAAGNDLRAGVHVANHHDVPRMFDDPPRAQRGLDQHAGAAMFVRIDRRQFTVVKLLVRDALVQVRINVKAASGADGLRRLAENGGKLHIMLGQSVAQLANIVPVQSPPP